ncbi:hypothetical protein [Lachnospira sp.]|jgi:hypothetical protein|uniref:hypothetical protein n=1 Tax=Lachnospira sp. TaxID=2049031 RepID=UPI00257E3AC1|nr:hypothetical protein [Lachnospira sp.]
MKITKQLSDTKFEIELEPHDMRNEQSIRVAHDYVRFVGNSGIQTNGSLTVDGPSAWCSNWIRTQHEVTIDIRDMVKFVLPLLNKNEYCTEEHLLNEDGTPNYTWGNSVIFFSENGEEKVYIRLDRSDEWTIIPRSVYNYLKNNNK